MASLSARICTCFSFRRFARTGSNTSLIFAFTRSDSQALQTPTLCVLAFIIISTAIFRSALSSTYIWQFPVPVSMTGIVLWLTTALISPLPPRGISTSTYSFIFINSAAVSREVSWISWIAFSVMSLAFRVSRIHFTIASFEWIASLPPFKITTFPVLKQRPKASAVTFGRAS